MSNLKAAAIAAVAIAAFTPAANAGDFIFKVHASELTTSAGLDRTAYRIERAAENACEAGKVRGLQFVSASRKCQARFAEEILSAIDLPQLSAVYAENALHATW